MWTKLINLILMPFEACFNIIGQPVLEGVSVLEILIAFIIILILIKMVIPIAHITIDHGFDTNDAHQRALINESRRRQRLDDQKEMTKWRYKYNHDKNFRKEQDGK